MVLFLEIGPPFVNPNVCPPGQHLDSHEEAASSQLSASIPRGGVPPSRGRARWLGGRRWRLSRRRQFHRKVSSYFPCISFLGKNFTFFSGLGFFYFCSAGNVGS